MKFKLVLIIFAGILILGACSKQENNKAEEESSAEIQSAGPRSFTLIYMDLKDALIDSDFNTSQKYASEMKVALDESFGDEFEEPMKVVVMRLSESENLDDQRTYFEQVSELLYGKLMNQGTERTIYKQFCPMAFDNKGAFWLSFDEEIANPYFGDVMHSCGFVQDTLTVL